MRDEAPQAPQADPPSVVVLTPESSLRNPLALARTMGRDLLAGRELAFQLLVRDLKGRYRQSLLGIAWALVPPLVTTLLFVSLDEAGAVTLSKNTPIPYPLFVLCGLVLWQSFVDALNAPLNMVTGNKDMLTKVHFPHEALLLAGAGQAAFDLLVRVLVLVPFFVAYSVAPTWGMVAAPLAVALLLLLGTALGTFLVPFGMLYTDVTKLLGAVTGLWLFLTPVLYTQPKGGVLGWVVLLNPVSALLTGARDLLTLGALQQPLAFFGVAAAALILALVAWVFYRVALAILIERLGS